MAKLSQQIKEKKGRRTRTDVVAEKQAKERAKKKFENLKSRAKNLQQTEFAGLKSVDEYEKKYTSLDPELQQFFQTPETVRAEKQARINETKTKLQERQAYADKKIQKERENLERDKERYKEKREYLRNRDYSSERYREKVDDAKEDLREDEDDFEEEKAYWVEYKKGLGEGLGQLNQGKEVKYKDVVNYADELGDYEERKTEARNEGKERDYKKRKKVEDLKEAGYKPYVVTRYKDGKPQQVNLGYSNLENKENPFVKLEEYDVKGKDISDYEKSKLGRVPVSQKLQFAGKEYKFKSNLQLYKNEGGKLLTKFGDTGLTEQGIIAEQKKIQAEKLSSQPAVEIEDVETKKSFIDKTWGKVKGVFTDYNLGLTGTSFPKLTIQKKKEDDAGQKVVRDLTKYGTGKAKQGIDWIDERVHWDITSGGTTPTVSLTFGKKDRETFGEVVGDYYSEQIGSKKEDVKKQTLGIEQLDTLEEEAQQKAQTEFERRHGADIIYERKSFEEAQKEFEQSDIYKDIQKEYSDKVTLLSQELPTGTKIKKGTEIFGLGLGKKAIETLTSPTKTVLTAGASYGGYSAFKSIPPKVSLGVTGGLFAYGTYKTFSPSSTLEEAGAGFGTALISGATLGSAGYKYLRQPVVKTKAVKPKLKSFKQKKVVGFEDPTKQVIKQAGRSYSVERTVFPKQKLSRQVVQGRRTIVTTKGRKLFRLKNIYEGVPTQQVPKRYTLQGLRGTYTTTFGKKSGYQKAFDRLTKYGYSSSQAKATLRYYSPKVIDTTLQKGIIQSVTSGTKITARGEFDILTEQPKILVDKKLGISTRYAKTKTDYFDFERSLLNVKGKDLVVTDVIKTSPYARLGKTTTTLQDVSVVKVGDAKKGVIKIGSRKGVDLFKEASYQDLKSYFAQRQIIPLKRRINLGKTETRIVKPSQRNVVEFDLDEISGITKTQGKIYGGGKKTPLSKTFGASEELKKVVRQFDKPAKTTKISDVNKVINKLDDVTSVSSKPIKSKFYGTGQYEQSVGGALPSQTQTQTAFKDLPLPTQKQFGVKDLIMVKQKDLLSLEVGNLLGLQTGIKANQKSRQQLKLDVELKNLLKSRVDLKVQKKMQLKQEMGLKQQLKLKAGVKPPTTPLTIGLTEPTIRPPQTPKINVRARPPIRFNLPKSAVEKKLKAKKKQEFDFAYLPDFTSRAIGLKPIKIKEDQLLKKVKQVQTGLEVRRPIKIQKG